MRNNNEPDDTMKRTQQIPDELNCTLYERFVRASVDRLDLPAIYINETKELFSTRDILELVEAASAGLFRLGIKVGTKVGIMLNGTIEEAVALLALNKLGAVCRYLDYMKSPLALKNDMIRSALDYVVVDAALLDMVLFDSEKHLQKIISVGNVQQKAGVVKWEDIISGEYEKTAAVPYIDNKPAIVINSSGTTGEPKPIVHTERSINSAVRKMENSDFPIGPGNVIVKNIPSNVGLGLITSLYTGLITGSLVVLMKVRDIQDVITELSVFVENFNSIISECNLSQNAKINIFSTPLFIGGMIQSDQTTNLSHIGSLLAAGSKIPKESLDQLSDIAKQKGCMVPICNGYGQNEMAGAVTLNYNNANKNGSAGIPTVGTSVIIVDLDSHRILHENEIGLILETSDSCFKEYENMPELTENAWLKLEDGSVWFNSNDLGYFDDNHFLYITGRLSRVAIRADFKISLDEIEKKLKNIPFVDDCAVIVPKTGGSMEEIVAFIKTEQTEGQLLEYINKTSVLSKFDMPSKIILVSEIPYRSIGKVDYQALEKVVNSN